jgi:site-specific recombinase XerD
MNKIVHENRLKKLENLADTFAKASISEATKKAYQTDWRDFWSFCRDNDLQYLPADSDTICLYLTSLAESGISVATIVRRCTSITAIHNASGFDSPVKNDKVGRVLRGIRNTLGYLPEKSKALSWSEVQRLAAKCGSLMLGRRNAAILLFGWASALRRSELCSINIGDLEILDEGAILTLRRSKTDREGRGAKIGVPRAQDESVCPVASVERWIARRSKSALSADEPLFVKIGVNGRNKWWWETGGRLSDRTISSIVKHYAKLSGLNPKLYSAHSLRRGLATEAGSRGVPERIISRHTRHRSIAVLRGYIEEGTIWEENPLPAIYTPRSGSITGLDE